MDPIWAGHTGRLGGFVGYFGMVDGPEGRRDVLSCVGGLWRAVPAMSRAEGQAPRPPLPSADPSRPTGSRCRSGHRS